jgi:hypothetical protein
MKNVKNLMVLVSTVLMAACLALAWFVKSKFWEAFLINASTSFLALGVGLIFVSIYLEKNARRGAVKSLLVLSQTAIGNVHNDFLNAAWAKFGRDRFGEIVKEYVGAKGAPQALEHQVRESMYDIVKNNKQLMARIEKLEEALVELSRMAGWDLDARLLRECLEARIAINRLKAVELDDSDEAKNGATEHLFDTDLHTQAAYHMLRELAGIVDER